MFTWSASILLGQQPVGFDAVVLEAVYPRIGHAVENRIRLRVGALAPLLTPLLLAQIPLRLHISPHDLCRDPEQTWGYLSHGAPKRTHIFSKTREPLSKESCQLTVEDSASNLKQLVRALR
jgi:hypothetical protein